jgi:hypothetical protein
MDGTNKHFAFAAAALLVAAVAICNSAVVAQNVFAEDQISVTPKDIAAEKPAPKRQPIIDDFPLLVFVTTILVDEQNKPQVWLHLVSSNEPLFKVAVGGKFQSTSFPAVHGTVVEINSNNVVFEIDGQRRKVNVGDALSVGTPLK